MDLELEIVRSAQPVEVREFERGRFELFRVGGREIGRASYEPGWRWTEHVRPLAGTEVCEVSHVGFVVCGSAAVRMADGRQDVMHAGDFFAIPPGHDSWVVGDEPYVSLHLLGAERYATSPQSGDHARAGDEALKRLDALIGRWKTVGRTVAADVIDAIDSYERLPGGALLHLIDARVGDQKVDGAEIIGYDPAREGYVTQYFGSDGPNGYEASLVDDNGVLVWTIRSTRDRFTGTFNDERNTITGHWEALDGDAKWQSWMDITLTRESS
jgi:hypothetical protein